MLFFDEMPWMDTQGSDFVAELEYFWANWVQNRDDIVFIACGSATSWMKEKLEDNQGGLHNRITHRIYLRPFYLSECKAYLVEHGFEWEPGSVKVCGTSVPEEQLHLMLMGYLTWGPRIIITMTPKKNEPKKKEEVTAE